MINIRPVNFDNNKELKEIINLDLREADRKEIMVSSGRSPKEALRFSLASSKEAYVIVEDGDIKAVFGITPTVKRENVVWLLSEKEFNNQPITVARGIKRIIERWKKENGRLFNFINAEREDDFKFLEFLGFKINKNNTFKAENKDHPFYLFFSK